MAKSHDDKLSDYINRSDLVKNFHLPELHQLLCDAHYINKVPTDEGDATPVNHFIDISDVGDLVYLCNVAEEAEKKTLALNLRRLLKTERFGWQWTSVYTGEVLLKSSHTRFVNEYSCKTDAWKHRFDINSGTDVILNIIAYCSNGTAIGKVVEVQDADTQTVVPGKRKLQPHDASQKKQKITYEAKLYENLGDDLIMQVFLQDADYTIDLRHWAPDKNDELKPTKKGIRLSLQQFVRLVWMQKQVQKFLDKMKAGEYIDEKLLVGGPVFMKLISPFLTIHIREFYADGTKLKPGWKGIIMRLRQWQKMLTLAKDKLEAVIPNFSQMKPCSFDTDHSNQEGMLNCPTCNYFDDDCDFE